MFYWGCAWPVYFSLFLKEGKKPMTYDCEKLPTPGLYIPEISQETFDHSDDGFRIHHFRHMVHLVAVGPQIPLFSL